MLGSPRIILDHGGLSRIILDHVSPGSRSRTSTEAVLVCGWLYRGGWGSETSLDKEAAARQDTAALLCSPASGPMVAVLLVDLPQRCNAFPAALKRCRSFRVSAVQAHLAVLL